MHVSNGKGRLYSGLQDRSTRVRGNMLGLSKTSIFRRCLAAWGKNQPTVYININEITLKQKLLQQCIIVSCLPCHPTNSLRLPSRWTISLPCLATLTKSSTFVILVTLADNDQSPSTPVRRSYPPCRPVAIPLAGTIGSPDSYL